MLLTSLTANFLYSHFSGDFTDVCFQVYLTINTTLMVTGLSSPDISPKLNLEEILSCQQRMSSLLETEMKSLCIMMGFPFSFYYTDAYFFVLGNVFDDDLLVSQEYACLLTLSVAWWDGETDESFVSLLTSPLHSILFELWFYHKCVSRHPQHTTSGRTCRMEKSKALIQSYLSGSPSANVLFPAACNVKPQLMMFAESTAWKQEAETSMI